MLSHCHLKGTHIGLPMQGMLVDTDSCELSVLRLQQLWAWPSLPHCGLMLGCE